MASDNEIIFSETQKFNQWWIYMVLGLAAIPFISFFFYQELTGKLIGNHPMNREQYIITIAIICLVSFLFVIMRLQTKIDSDGIHVRFFPFKLNYGLYKWEQIRLVSVRNYEPISQYGGWGIRYSFNNGKALTVSGDMGIQIETKSGKRVLIGTQRPEAAKNAIEQLRTWTNE